MPGLTIKPATPERWNAVRDIFRTRGDRSRCWCQYFLDPNFSLDDRGGNMSALKAQLRDQDPPPGLIATLEGEPVGWVQVGPRERYERLRKQGDVQSGQWIVTCFVVPPK